MRQVNIKISRAYRILQSLLTNELKNSELSNGIFNYLSELREKDGMNLSELSQAVCVNNAYTTRATSRLIELGYIRKVQDTNDLRGYRVYLTAAGKTALEKIDEVMEKLSDVFHTNISQKEFDAFVKVLDQVYENSVTYLQDEANYFGARMWRKVRL